MASRLGIPALPLVPVRRGPSVWRGSSPLRPVCCVLSWAVERVWCNEVLPSGHTGQSRRRLVSGPDARDCSSGSCSAHGRHAPPCPGRPSAPGPVSGAGGMRGPALLLLSPAPRDSHCPSSLSHGPLPLHCTHWRENKATTRKCLPVCCLTFWRDLTVPAVAAQRPWHCPAFHPFPGISSPLRL